LKQPKSLTVSSIAAAWPRAVCTLIVIVTSATPANALDCPAPQALTHPGVLKETPTQIADISKRLATGDLNSQLSQIVAELRARHPGVENAELVNYLVTAYCPVVAGLPGLSDAEKQARVRAFANQLAQMIY
jgi:hypothetical protein